MQDLSMHHEALKALLADFKTKHPNWDGVIHKSAHVLRLALWLPIGKPFWTGRVVTDLPILYAPESGRLARYRDFLSAERDMADDLVIKMATTTGLEFDRVGPNGDLLGVLAYRFFERQQ